MNTTTRRSPAQFARALFGFCVASYGRYSAAVRHSWRLAGTRFRAWRTAAHLQRRRRGLRTGQRLVGIVLVEHLGDIVACEPVIRHLRRRGPDDVLLWLVRPVYRELIAGHPGLDGCIEVHSQTEAMLLAQHPVFDEIVNLHVNGRACRSLGTVLEKRTGDPSVSIHNYLDYGSLLEAFSRSAGLPPLTDAPQFTLTDDLPADIVARLPPGPFLVLHAATNDGVRDWTDEGWAHLLRSLRAHTDLACVEIGHRAVVAHPGNGVVDLCGALTLQQSAAVIARSTGFIGVESGPAHLANALRRKSLVLMGRYYHWPQYMPYTGFLRDHADTMLLRWDGPVAAIPPDDCFARIRQIWTGHIRAETAASAPASPDHPATR